MFGSPLIIREARADDEIDDVSRSAFEELRRIYRPNEAARAGKAALDTSLARIVAVDERDDIVGTVQYRIDAGRLHLIGLAVHPDHRKIGVARRLVDHLAEIARSRGLAIVSLYAVMETGNPAVFEHLGFRSIREQAADWCLGVNGEPMTEVYMERAVEGAGYL